MSKSDQINADLAAAAVHWLDCIRDAKRNEQSAISICEGFHKEATAALARHNPFNRLNVSDDGTVTPKSNAHAQTAPLPPETVTRLKQLANDAEAVFSSPESDGFSRNIDFIEWLKSSVAVLTGGEAPHQDDMAVDRFAEAMKQKLKAAREKGRSGWDTPQCTQVMLSDMLREHVEKGDPLDVGNFCMFLWARGEGIGSDIPVADIETCERAVFESLIEKQQGRRPLLWSTVFIQADTEVPPHCVGVYMDVGVESMWRGWKARAESGMAPKPPEPVDTSDATETRQLVGDMLQTIDSATAFVSRKLRDGAPRLMRKAEAWLKSH